MLGLPFLEMHVLCTNTFAYNNHVIAIIYAIYGTPVLPLLVPFITALLAMITAWLFFNTDRCKNFFNTGKCQ